MPTSGDGKQKGDAHEAQPSDDEPEELVELLPGGGRLDQTQEDRPETGTGLP